LFGRDVIFFQSDPDYPLDVANDMQKSSITDGRNMIGAIIDQAYADRIVRYVAVRTRDTAALPVSDSATVVEHAEVIRKRLFTVVEHVFLEPS
jgi:hypothetical protein